MLLKCNSKKGMGILDISPSPWETHIYLKLWPQMIPDDQGWHQDFPNWEGGRHPMKVTDCERIETKLKFAIAIWNQGAVISYTLCIFFKHCSGCNYAWLTWTHSWLCDSTSGNKGETLALSKLLIEVSCSMIWGCSDVVHDSTQERKETKN